MMNKEKLFSNASMKELDLLVQNIPGGEVEKINGRLLYLKQKLIWKYMQLVFMDQMMISQEISLLDISISFKSPQTVRKFLKAQM